MRSKIVYGGIRGDKIRYYLDGKQVTKKKYDEVVTCKFTGDVPMTLMESSKAWPRLSDSLGVNPKQREAAQEESIRLGVPTEFAADGRAIMRNNAHQRDFIKALGKRNTDGGEKELINRDGGYGDVTG